jgi:hypothetical protein
VHRRAAALPATHSHRHHHQHTHTAPSRGANRGAVVRPEDSPTHPCGGRGAAGCIEARARTESGGAEEEAGPRGFQHARRGRAPAPEEEEETVEAGDAGLRSLACMLPGGGGGTGGARVQAERGGLGGGTGAGRRGER